MYFGLTILKSISVTVYVFQVLKALGALRFTKSFYIYKPVIKVGVVSVTSASRSEDLTSNFSLYKVVQI